MSDKNENTTKKERITLRIEPHLLSQAQEIAEAMDERSLSYVIRKAMRECFPKMRKDLNLA